MSSSLPERPDPGSKRLIEAPCLVSASESLDVSVVTVLLADSHGDSITKLV